MQNIVNFYVINFISFFANHYFKKCKNLTIKNSINQLINNFVLA